MSRDQLDEIYEELERRQVFVTGQQRCRIFRQISNMMDGHDSDRYHEGRNAACRAIAEVLCPKLDAEDEAERQVARWLTKL